MAFRDEPSRVLAHLLRDPCLEHAEASRCDVSNPLPTLSIALCSCICLQLSTQLMHTVHVMVQWGACDNDGNLPDEGLCLLSCGSAATTRIPSGAFNPAAVGGHDRPCCIPPSMSASPHSAPRIHITSACCRPMPTGHTADAHAIHNYQPILRRW
jgi:hypothetical protein